MMNEIRLLDDDGNAVRRGDVGELYNRSPCLYLGYGNNPEATQAAMRDGWFSAGDMAWQDEDGCYDVVDRKKDMYISGGVNVYPREVEEFLFRLPGVKEAAVVGVADDYWGEAGKAVLVMHPGATIDADAVIAACKSNLAGYKVPRHVGFAGSARSRRWCCCMPRRARRWRRWAWRSDWRIVSRCSRSTIRGLAIPIDCAWTGRMRGTMAMP